MGRETVLISGEVRRGWRRHLVCALDAFKGSLLEMPARSTYGE